MPMLQQLPVATARRMNPAVRGLMVAVMLCAVASPRSHAQDMVSYYRQNCMSCHTIGGGRLAGPDLKDVTARQDREWLISFILDPQAKLNTGDPYAQQLLDEARGVVMPKIGGMTPDRAGLLLDLIDAESALPESQFKGVAISNEPFTDADVQRGRALFMGTKGLSNRSAACVSCHVVPGIGGLGGGKLGPDLTRVYEQLQGRTALSAWLLAPATPTMQSLLQGKPLDADEVHALVALFEESAKNGQASYEVAQMSFSLLGFGGAIVLLILFDVVWKGRFQSVRRALVRAKRL
jgi:mono/diheme cytochrome c family protein